VRSIHEHRHAVPVAKRSDFSNGQDDGGFGRDVIDKGEASSWTELSLYGFNKSIRSLRDVWYFNDSHVCTMSSRHILGRVPDCTVSEIENQQLIAITKIEIAQDGIDSRRGVIDKRDVLTFNSNEGRNGVRSHTQSWPSLRRIPQNCFGQLS
jgi:hypothetical protein